MLVSGDRSLSVIVWTFPMPFDRHRPHWNAQILALLQLSVHTSSRVTKCSNIGHKPFFQVDEMRFADFNNNKRPFLAESESPECQFCDFDLDYERTWTLATGVDCCIEKKGSLIFF